MPEFVVDDVHDDAQKAFDSLRDTEPAVTETPVVEEKAAAEAKPETQAETDRKTDSTGRDHGKDGKFVAKGEKAEPDAPAPVPPDKTPPQKDGAAAVPGKEPALADAVAVRPPSSWPIPAKAAWDKLPPEVQQAVAKREVEVNNGFAKLAQYKDIERYADIASRSGQRLPDMLQNFFGISETFQRNSDQGFLSIAQNLGLNQQQAADTFLRLATQLGAQPAVQTHQNGSAQQTDATDQNGVIAQLQQLLQPLAQKTQTLEQQLAEQGRRDQAQRQQSAATTIERFRSDPKHRYYDEVEQIVGDLLEKGIVRRSGDAMADLTAAYEQAVFMHPEVRAQLIKEQVSSTQDQKAREAKDAAEKARNASRSVTGSPSPGAQRQVKSAPGANYDDDLHNDVAAAVRAVAGRA